MKKVLFPILALVLALGLSLPMAAPVAANSGTVVDFETTGLAPGASVEGLGTVHDYLDIQSTQVVVLVKEGESPRAYTADSMVNGCLDGDYGIGDKHDEESTADKKIEDYVFTFAPGITVTSFSIQMFDYGDYFPYPGSGDHIAKLVGYDAADNLVAIDTLAVPSTTSDGDACSEISPGVHTFTISGTGIAKVKIKFEGDYSVDGGIALDNIEFVGAGIEKTLWKDASQTSDGYLGDIITVKIVVKNAYGDDLTVEDVIPDGLKYILGTFEVDGSPVTPTIADSTISTTVGTGTYIITFDVQVVEVQCTNTTATNWAYLWYVSEQPVAEDSADITLWPYEGFSKEIDRAWKVHDTAEYPLPDPTVVPIGTDVHWIVDIVVTNIPGDSVTTMQGVVVQDRLGGDLELDRYRLSTGRVWKKLSGKTDKVHLTWKMRPLVDSQSEQLRLEISTDLNPGQNKNFPVGHQEYTSPGWHELNSGAVVKFIDVDGTGFQLSAHTAPLAVYVPDAMLELEDKDTSDWSIIEGGDYGELHYNTSGDEFYFVFQGYGLEPEEEYSLIYYADFDPRFTVWGGNNPGALIGTGTADGSGNLVMSGSKELNMNLPCSPDWNIAPVPDYCDYHNEFDDYDHCSGAKIWLVPSDCLTGSTDLPVVVWAPTRFLFETDLITYTDTNAP